MTAKVEWVLPSAEETLKAQDAQLACSWVELGGMVWAYAEAMATTLVQLGPKYCGTCPPGQECCGSHYDPVSEEGHTEAADAYCRLARALGVL